MFMKKYFRYALMAALTVGLSLAVTSCKDDDKDNGNVNGEPTAEELAVEHAETFWSVAANLVSPFDVTAEYENKTFEPTIGTPLDGNTTIRVVNCGSMASAASRFTSITGVEIDENTTTSTYQDDAVGTLVYTKTNDATSLATIDVSIKQIPHLQKIIFKTSEQMGANGKFSGTAYYSFGDVIALDNEDGLQEYWVCVRPALGPAGKEDTHWVTLSQLPDKNVWTYEGKKKPITFRLPQQLGTDEIQMQNLAELLYAVCNPEQWWKNLQDNKGVDLFGDLYHERAQYFNQYFWQTVQKFWSDKSAGQSISEKLFGYDFDEMKKIINDQNALHLLRKGFSWYTTSSNSPTLYEYTYSNGTGKKSNMHSYKSKSVSKNVMTGDGIKLDCVADYTQNHWICPAFFGDEQPRFIFRFATGKDLFGADPGVHSHPERPEGVHRGRCQSQHGDEQDCRRQDGRLYSGRRGEGRARHALVLHHGLRLQRIRKNPRRPRMVHQPRGHLDDGRHPHQHPDRGAGSRGGLPASQDNVLCKNVSEILSHGQQGLHRKEHLRLHQGEHRRPLRDARQRLAV